MFNFMPNLMFNLVLNALSSRTGPHFGEPGRDVIAGAEVIAVAKLSREFAPSAAVSFCSQRAIYQQQVLFSESIC